MFTVTVGEIVRVTERDSAVVTCEARGRDMLTDLSAGCCPWRFASVAERLDLLFGPTAPPSFTTTPW